MPHRIVFTTSPWTDARTGKWMLSAFVSIQLDAAGRTRLAQFPDILSWMDRLREADFFVQWNNALPQPLEPVASRWDDTLYKDLFHNDLSVKSFAPVDISKLLIRSYPAKHIRDHILDAYRDVGNLRLDKLPKATFFTKDFTGLQPIGQVKLKQTKPRTDTSRQATVDDFVTRGSDGRKTAMDLLRRQKAIGFKPVKEPGIDFGQFLNFHTKAARLNANTLRKPKRPEFEYHDVLSILTSYPVILRKLGLVIDFILPGPPPAPNGTVRILPANLGLSDAADISSPATAYLHTGRGFHAAARPGSPIEMGFLKVNTEEFDVVQIDADGTALKLASHTDTLQTDIAKRLVEKSNTVTPILDFPRFRFIPIPNAAPGQPAARPATPDDDEEDDPEAGLPPIRSAGIGIIRNGLADQVIRKLTRSLDVWKSFVNPTAILNASALLNRAQPQAKPAVKPGLTPDTRRQLTQLRLPTLNLAFQQRNLIPQPTETLYADDIVFGYRLDVAYEDRPDTWFSLHKRCNSYAFVPVDGPERRIPLAADEEIDEGCLHLSLTEDDDDPDDTKVNEVIARWEGWSLSVPRLGKGINNTGPEVSADDEERRKHRPDAATPFRLQVDIRTAPRSLPRLRFGRKYRVRIRTVDIAGNGLPHDAPAENPALTVRSGIEYRRFDPLPTPVLWQADEVAGGDRQRMRDRDGESLQHLVVRSNKGIDSRDYEKTHLTTILQNGRAVGTLQYLPEAVRFLTAPRTSQQTAETHGMFDAAMDDPAKARDTYAFITSRDRETTDDGSRKARLIPPDTGQLDIDYLADPMAAGVIFTMKSDTSFETPWRKGDSYRFSFHFDENVNDLNNDRAYTVDQWKNPRSIKIRVVEGTGSISWVNRVFTIPVAKGSIVEIEFASYWRPSDLNRVSGLLNILGKGVNAQQALTSARNGRHWMFSPWRTLRLVHAVQQPLRSPRFNPALTLVQREHLQTFARIVTLIDLHGASTDHVEVGAQWTEWVDDLARTRPEQRSVSTHVASIPVLYGDNRLEMVRLREDTPPSSPEMLPAIRHAFQDTRHRKVRYRPVATTRFREYFTGIIDTARLRGEALPLTAEGDAVELLIPSSARPPAPVVDYLVPSLSWNRSDAKPTRIHLRTANIRVYLRRPWYASGDGERLAVILAPKGRDAAADPALSRYATLWGLDPAFEGGRLNGRNFPDIDSFPNAETDNVRLPEDEDTTVTVATFPVDYDEERQLHYADIPVNTQQAYTPFLRLSLARYQRHSVRLGGRDCCLSGSVQADWMQILPSRIATIKDTNLTNAWQVSLKGPAPFHTRSDGNARVRIEVTVELRQSPTSDAAHLRLEGPGIPDPVIARHSTDLRISDIRGGNIDFQQTIRVDTRHAGLPMRIVIREFELHEGDPLRNFLILRPTGQPAQPTQNLQPRPAFLDIFEING
jgi:hypothetical protein